VRAPLRGGGDEPRVRRHRDRQEKVHLLLLLPGDVSRRGHHRALGAPGPPPAPRALGPQVQAFLRVADRERLDDHLFRPLFDPARLERRDSQPLGSRDHRGHRAFGDEQGEAGAHVETAVSLGRVHARLSLHEGEHRGDRGERRHPVGERRRVPHQLAPAVPGDVRDIVHRHLRLEQLLDQGGIENRGVEQRLAVEAAVGKARRVPFRQGFGQPAGERNAVGVDAAAGDDDDPVPRRELPADDEPLLGPDDADARGGQVDGAGGHYAREAGRFSAPPGGADGVARARPPFDQVAHPLPVGKPVGAPGGPVGVDIDGARPDGDDVVDGHGDRVLGDQVVPGPAGERPHRVRHQRLRPQALENRRHVEIAHVDDVGRLPPALRHLGKPRRGQVPRRLRRRPLRQDLERIDPVVIHPRVLVRDLPVARHPTPSEASIMASAKVKCKPHPMPLAAADQKAYKGAYRADTVFDDKFAAAGNPHRFPPQEIPRRNRKYFCALTPDVTPGRQNGTRYVRRSCPGTEAAEGRIDGPIGLVVPERRHCLLQHLISVPTNMGKNAAVSTAWLWNRVLLGCYNRLRRLVFCFPVRKLVEPMYLGNPFKK